MRYALVIVFTLFANAQIRAQETDSQGFVSVQLNGQFGNQLFEIATAYAYSLDHHLVLTVPDLVNKKKDGIAYNAEKIFLSKIASDDMPGVFMKWKEPSFNYSEIPASNSIELEGYFQSEKYFKHRREELLDFFAPPEGLNEIIITKYPFLASNSLVVGVQIRDYRVDKMYGKAHPTIGRSYYEKAMSLFPKETIFLVSSNNREFAEWCTQGLSENIIYLKAGYIEEFYTLALCKSFIISNSSFGWWSAWLSQSENKIVTVPTPWFAPPYNNKEMTEDLIPDGWTIIQNTKKKKQA